MKIAVSSQGTTMDSPVDPRFGRAGFFIVFDTETKTSTAISNTANQNAIQGAGIQSAKTIADLKAETLVTGHVGPKAHAALTAAGIAIYTGASGTVRQAVDAFLSGTLAKTDQATVNGHWS